MTVIHQGDQYLVPITITQGETVITPEICSDVRIMLGSYLKYFSAGEIIYDENAGWLFPLTEDMSRSMSKRVDAVVGVKFGPDDIYHTKKKTIVVDDNNIGEAWRHE